MKNMKENRTEQKLVQSDDSKCTKVKWERTSWSNLQQKEVITKLSMNICENYQWVPRTASHRKDMIDIKAISDRAKTVATGCECTNVRRGPACTQESIRGGWRKPIYSNNVQMSGSIPSGQILVTNRWSISRWKMNQSLWSMRGGVLKDHSDVHNSWKNLKVITSWLFTIILRYNMLM